MGSGVIAPRVLRVGARWKMEMRGQLYDPAALHGGRGNSPRCTLHSTKINCFKPWQLAFPLPGYFFASTCRRCAA